MQSQPEKQERGAGPNQAETPLLLLNPFQQQLGLEIPLVVPLKGEF